MIRTDPLTDRCISLYGWVRGIPLLNHSMVHIPGVGDLRIKEVFFALLISFALLLILLIWLFLLPF